MIDPRRPDFANAPVSHKRPHSWYDRSRSLSDPIVSIVTPFHSGARFFDETAQSVLSQSLQHFEWAFAHGRPQRVDAQSQRGDWTEPGDDHLTATLWHGLLV
jgi:hypothetical protein